MGFLSFGSPHVGYNTEDASNSWIRTGIWVLTKWKGSKSLEELSMADKPDNPREGVLYQLSNNKALDFFQYVVLVSSPQDGYAPLESCRIEHAGVKTSANDVQIDDKNAEGDRSSGESSHERPGKDEINRNLDPGARAGDAQNAQQPNHLNSTNAPPPKVVPRETLHAEMVANIWRDFCPECVDEKGSIINIPNTSTTSTSSLHTDESEEVDPLGGTDNFDDQDMPRRPSLFRFDVDFPFLESIASG